MKDLFKDYYSIAECLDCPVLVKKKETIAKEMMENEKTIITVTGMRSSGKTTAINEMIGYEVWEPGNMDDDEKPLRISFEPMETDDRYECILVANREWNELDALIYEFREEQMVKNGALTENALASDKVFFMISATAPFNINEINLLKTMDRLNCQIIVHGISVIKEKERDKVKEYISKINASLGLPAPLYLDDDIDFSKSVRSSLPTYVEQKEYRTRKMKIITEELVTLLENELESRMKDYNEHKNNSQDTMNRRSLISSCQTLRLDALEYCEKVKKKAMDSLNESDSSMIERIMKEVSLNDLETIGKLAQKKFNQKAMKAIEQVRDGYFSTINTIESSASILGLPGWDTELVENLKKSFPDISRIKVGYNPTIHSGGNKPESVIMTESSKVLVGTGLIAGGFAIAPLPTLLSISGVIASTGVGGSMFLKKRNKEKEHDLRIALKKAFSEGEDQLKSLIRETADGCYECIVRALKNSEMMLTQPNHDDNDKEQENMKKKLDEAAMLLQYIKGNEKKEN